jgi:glycosyltransferase involved in cell wall biosynthesis
MKFSIVTPVLNREKHIERAIRSASEQQHPDFEHIVIDGGSTDQTVEVLNRFPHLRTVSEPDGGCVFAMNKGLRLITGEVFGWLNSDEKYLPGTFRLVEKYFRDNPSWDVIFGHYTFMDAEGNEIGRCGRHRFSRTLQIAGLNWIVPSAAFVRVSALNDIGGRLDERWKDVFDHDLWIRLSERHKVAVVPEYLSSFGLHPESGVVGTPERAIRERALVRQHYRKDSNSAKERLLAAFVDGIWLLYRHTKWRRMLSLTRPGG